MNEVDRQNQAGDDGDETLPIRTPLPPLPKSSL